MLNETHTNIYTGPRLQMKSVQYKVIPFDDITVSSAFKIEKLIIMKFVRRVIFAPSPLIFTLKWASFSVSSASI